MRLIEALKRSTRALMAMCATWLVAGTPTALAEEPVTAPATRGADAIVGFWRPAEREVVVEVRREGDRYRGVVVESGEPKAVGKVMLRELVFDSAAGHWKGEVFAVKRKEWVPATLELKGTDALVLRAGRGRFSREVTWKRR